jgi:hypothetical protein
MVPATEQWFSVYNINCPFQFYAIVLCALGQIREGKRSVVSIV